MRTLRKEQEALLTKAGKRPAVKSKARARWDEISDLLAQKMAEWTELDRAERNVKNAPATTPAVTPPAAPAAPAAKPAVAAKPASKAPVAKKVEAPAPAVAAETVDEEAARKAEAEDMKRRLEALEKKAEKPAPKVEPAAPETKAEKPEPKEIPEKLREPVGTTEFGAKEGEEEILRGPQGMLFPMSKREELEYAKKKGAPAEFEGIDEADIEELPPAGQQKLDFDKKPEPEPKAVDPTDPVATATKDAVQASPSWADKYKIGGQVVVYADGEVALVRSLNKFNEPRYFAMNTSGSQATTAIHANPQPSWLTAAQRTRLEDIATQANLKEYDLAGANLDGPFTTGQNVIATDGVGEALQKYTTDLMKSIGLGDLRIFLYNSPDVAASGFVDRYKLYGEYATPASYKRENLNGSSIEFGIF
jgi:hypothetical protein